MYPAVCLVLTCALALAGLASGLGQQSPAVIQFSSPANNVAEDAGTATITLRRTGDLRQSIGTAVLSVQRLGDTSQEMTVDFTTSDVTARGPNRTYAIQASNPRFHGGCFGV